MSEQDSSDLAVADSGGVQGRIVQPLVAMLKPAASFSDHGWRAIAMCGTRWMVAARYEDAVTVENGLITKTWDCEAHAKLFAAAPELLEALSAFVSPFDGDSIDEIEEAYGLATAQRVDKGRFAMLKARSA